MTCISKNAAKSPDFLLIDLFCGAGGTSTGAEKSGVKFVLLSDPKALVIKIYHLEHKGLNMREPDQTGARPAVFFLNSDLTLSSAYQPEDMRYHLTSDELLARFKAAK